MPYEIDKTLTISQKMIDDAKADGSLYRSLTDNLLIRRIKEALGSRYKTNSYATVTVRMLSYSSDGYPLSPLPDLEQNYYLPNAVVTQLDHWYYNHQQAVAKGQPWAPDCPTMRFTLRYRSIPVKKE